MENFITKCPIDGVICNSNISCIQCDYYNEHINDEIIEDNKKDNGGYNRND